MSTNIEATRGQLPPHADHWLGLDHEECIKEIEGQIHIPAKAMSITWGNNANFWRWPALHSIDKDKFGFDEAAELHQVSWLEVKATIDLAKYSLFTYHHHKAYEVVYHIKFKGDAFGWRDLPVTFVVVAPNSGEMAGSSTKENVFTTKRDLNPNKQSHGKRNEWIEIVGGVFRLPDDAVAATKIELGMVEVTSAKWKGGLVLAGVTIRPHKSAGKDPMSSAHA